MKQTVLVALVVIAAACGPVPVGYEAQALIAPVGVSPDPELTPGDLCTRDDRDYDGDRYAEQIPHCRRNVTRARKVKIAALYGVSEAELPDYQVDHYLPLGLGGSNSDENLWPLIFAEARRKAALEQDLYNQLNGGEITQAEALATIRAWR